MAECLERGDGPNNTCRQAAVVQIYAGYVGPNEPHRYTGIAFCYDHAMGLLGRHKDHFWSELDHVEHDRALGKLEAK